MMGISRLLGAEPRATSNAPLSGTSSPEPWLIDLLGGVLTATGIRITAAAAMTVPGVAACVQVMADDLAKVPLLIFKRTADGGRERAVNHPLYKLLKDRPAPWLTSFAWRRAMFQTAAVAGNSYSRVIRNADGAVRQFTPTAFQSVTHRWAPDGEPFFDINLPAGGVLQGLAYPDVIHFAYRGGVEWAANGGIIGRSPLDTHKEAIALSLATEQFAARYFRNGARPSAVVEMDKVFPNDEVANRTRMQVERVLSGVDNAGKIAIFELGMKLKQWSANNDDSQLVELRKQQAGEIARMFRMPPHKIGIMDQATFSNIEMQAIEYVGDNLVPLAAMSEQQLELSLLSDAERDDYFIEYDMDGLLRGDQASRYKAYAIGRQWGWLSADDVRSRENMNNLPDGAGQIYVTPLNMAKAGEDPSADAPPADDGAPGQSRNRPAN